MPPKNSFFVINMHTILPFLHKIKRKMKKYAIFQKNLNFMLINIQSERIIMRKCFFIEGRKGIIKMIKVGIIGATGYAGGELVRILMGHKDVEIKWYGSKSYIDKKYYEVYQNMFQIVDDVCLDDNIEALAEQVDVIFTATPQGYLASLLNEEILSKVKIVDLSADYRIKDVATYEKWYKIEHKSPQFIEEAVYGLCEVNREDVKKARLVANPGCYTTCSILTI